MGGVRAGRQAVRDWLPGWQQDVKRESCAFPRRPRLSLAASACRRRCVHVPAAHRWPPTSRHAGLVDWPALLPRLFTRFMWAFEVPVGAATGTPPFCEPPLPASCLTFCSQLPPTAIVNHACSHAHTPHCPPLSSPFLLRSLPRPWPLPADVCRRAEEPQQLHRKVHHLPAGARRRQRQHQR